MRRLCSSFAWLLLFVSAPMLSGCSSSPPERSAAPTVQVETHGALRDFMHGGDTSAVVRLETLAADPDRVGLGALSGFRGEVTLIDGEMLLAYPAGAEDSRTSMLSPAGEGAILFVTARVPRWQSVVLDTNVAWEDLDAAVGSLAGNAGIDVSEAFPFIIEGSVQNLEWHVIDGTRIPPDAVGHAAHREAAVTHHMAEGQATLVGFYSDHHQGVFTHMDTQTHVHVRVTEPLSSGHVDRVGLQAGATLRLPATTRRP